MIHNEQVRAENYLTAQGRALHERVDDGEPETRNGVRFERSVHVSAENLGVHGVLDMVERDIQTCNDISFCTGYTAKAYTSEGVFILSA